MSDYDSTADTISELDEEEDFDDTSESGGIFQWRECSVIVERLRPEIEREAMIESGRSFLIK